MALGRESPCGAAVLRSCGAAVGKGAKRFEVGGKGKVEVEVKVEAESRE